MHMIKGKQVDKEQLEKAVETSVSFREAASKLGVPDHRRVGALSRQYGFSTEHFYHGRACDDMVGKKYGMLTVCEVRVQQGKRGRNYAICLCECGKHKEIRADGLKSGHYISCGCHSHNRWNTVGSKNHSFKGVGSIGSSYFGQVKRSAERRGIKFDWSIDEAAKTYEKQDKKCVLTGVPLQFGRIRHHHETTASPDRIDSQKGYTAENVQWVLKDINRMKSTLDNEYFIKLCNLVAKHNPREV